MNKKWLTLLFCGLFVMVGLTACGGDDDEPGGGNNSSSISKNDLLGVWANPNNSWSDPLKGLVMFPDNKCWVMYDSNTPELCSWNFNKKSGLLATTSARNPQWEVTISDDIRWSGISLSGGIQTFTRDYSFLMPYITNFQGYGHDKKLKKDISFEWSSYLKEEYRSEGFIKMYIKVFTDTKSEYYTTKDGKIVNLIKLTGVGKKEGVFKCDYYEWENSGEMTKLGSGEFEYTTSKDTGNRLLTFSGLLDFTIEYASAAFF